MSETTIVEINGVKMEVDMRTARVVHENLRVGAKVKILAKGQYEGAAVYPGIIVGFEPFTELPTIIVAYIKQSYAAAELLFAYVNSKSADKWSLVPCVDDHLPISKGDVIAVFNRDIEKHRAAITDIEARQEFFLRHFNEYFVSTEQSA